MNYNVWKGNPSNPTTLRAALSEQNEFERLQEARSTFRGSTNQTKTRLVRCPVLASDLGVGSLFVKDEGQRDGMPAFKVLGVSFALDQLLQKEPIQTVCTMTDGNHGLALAATAQRLGIESVVFVPANLTKARERAITNHGAQVIRIRGTYDDAIAVVRTKADEMGWLLVSDTSWAGYCDIPRMIVAGYGTLFQEVEEDAAGTVFSHVVVQAGVGGLASAAAAWLHARMGSECWSADVALLIVEPIDAACCFENARAGAGALDLQPCSGQTNSLMAGLNCGIPSLVAWPLIHRTASHYVVVGDEWAKVAMRALAAEGIVAGESGAAGLAGLMAASDSLSLPVDAVVLVLNTESDTDPDLYAEIVGNTMSSRGALVVRSE